jgi:hypothetical protein
VPTVSGLGCSKAAIGYWQKIDVNAFAIELFYNKNTLCYKNIKKSGAIFSFCHKRMQWTALGAKNQIK